MFPLTAYSLVCEEFAPMLEDSAPIPPDFPSRRPGDCSTPPPIDARRDGLTDKLTLAQFFKKYVKPVCLVAGGAAPRNLEQYAESLAYWARFTRDPPLGELSQADCAAFVAGLRTLTNKRTGQPISPNTIRKHCTEIQRVLDLAGPRGRQRSARLAAGLITQVPYCERPPQRRKPPTDSYTLIEVQQVLAAVGVARRPRLIDTSVPPAVWWDSLIRFLLNVGTRIETTMALTWSMVVAKPDGPWLVVPPEIYKGRRHGLELPLNAPAFAALVALRGRDQHLFPWPYSLNYLHQCRKKLLAASTLPPERRLGFHALRKTLATELARQDGKLAQAAMGHAAFSTTSASYIHPNVMRAAFDRLPQPGA
jgi:integrase